MSNSLICRKLVIVFFLSSALLACAENGNSARALLQAMHDSDTQYAKNGRPAGCVEVEGGYHCPGGVLMTGGYSSGAGIPVGPGITGGGGYSSGPGISSGAGITAGGYSSGPGLSGVAGYPTGPGISSSPAIPVGPGIPVSTGVAVGPGIIGRGGYNSGPGIVGDGGIAVGPGLTAGGGSSSGPGISSGTGIRTSSEIKTEVIRSEAGTQKTTTAGNSGAQSSQNTNLFAKVTNVAKVAGNAIIASEKAVGENISAAIGANTYRQQIQQIQKQEYAQFNQLVVQRNVERVAGRDTSKLDTVIKNYSFTKDNTNEVFPALNKTNGQVVRDFGGVALDVVTAGAGSGLKTAKSLGVATDVARGVEATRAAETAAKTANVGRSVEAVVPAQKATFANIQFLRQHFADHGKDFGSPTLQDYQNKAAKFLTTPRNVDTLEGVRKNGDIVRYNTNTDEFGILRKDGIVRTYYKPDPIKHGRQSNLDYYYDQFK